ncbi:hypothetical protein CL617_02105 [archaeon]|nr:hypothetical protein [archaeon]|tara:strand:- start:301 stop:585 length:285 start_codon:yes stop_codon:yes gene_type:complete
MECVYIMEAYFDKGDRTINYGIQIGRYGDTITVSRKDENQLINIIKKLSKKYIVVVDEPEEIDTEEANFAESTYRKITNEDLLKRLHDEKINWR